VVADGLNGVDEPVGQGERLVGVDGERERASGEPDSRRVLAGQGGHCGP